MKKNGLLFLDDLSRVEDINGSSMGKIQEKSEKLKLLVDYLSQLKENKRSFWKYILEFWKLKAYREILQVIYFKLFS